MIPSATPHVPTVLLQGETGTGKGLVARIIHDSGPRAHGPFIEVNCAAIPETMLEAELFGFEAGTFTDAKHAKPGLFEAASGGTLFLDEIDALPLVLQGKLLTAIESKRVRRLGAVVERPVDVKLIAATNAILPEAMATGRFRADLYHRLAVVVLILPPVRARGADVLVLAEAFMQHYTAAHGVPSKRLSATAQAWLREYTWPGNVRELSHVMERVTLLHMGEEVEAETLRQLCPPTGRRPPCGMVRLRPPEPAPERTPASRGRADPAGAGADRGQCGPSGAAAGGEPGYGTLSHAALWDCAATSRGCRLPSASPGSPGQALGDSCSQRDALLQDRAAAPYPTPCTARRATLHRGRCTARRQARRGDRAPRLIPRSRPGSKNPWRSSPWS